MSTILETRYTQIGDFFNTFLDDQMKNDLGIIIVTHILPDRFIFLNAISKLAKIIAVIPKPKSIHYPTLQKLDGQYQFEFLSREQIANTDAIENLLSNSNCHKFILLDIGGYFAPVANKLGEKFSGRLLGVVEDTENGHQKYSSIPEKLPFPIISVARSPLKEQEDYLVGQSIFFSTESLLREINILPNYLNLGVLGYGKIGKSVAQIAKSKCRLVSVYDSNPILQTQAACHGFKIPTFENLLKSSDVIISCTGNHAINDSNIKLLKNGCLLSSSTSADDEFSLKKTLNTYQKRQITQNITMVYTHDNSFYLMNEGNAVNFLHNAVVGDFIFLVQSEILEAIKEIYYHANQYNQKINSLSDNIRNQIATKFILSLNSKFN
jgi:adenosylhomocysteinase